MKKEIKLIKHSALIQISNKISAVQRKSFNYLLYVAKKQLQEKKIFKFKVGAAEILQIIGLGKDNYTYLKKFLRELKNIDVKYNLLGKDKKQIWGEFSLLAGFEWRDGVITYSFPHQILDVLIDPNVYACLDLIIIKGLRSKYAIAIYELVKDFEKIEIPKMEINNFKTIIGVEKNRYNKNMPMLRKCVIETAVQEINSLEKINFLISYELFKTGRTYTHVKFYIKKKAAIKKLPAVRDNRFPDRSGSEDDGPKLRLQLRPGFENLKGLKALIIKSLRENGEKYTERNIAYANKNAKSNYPAFLKKAIFEDWAAGEAVLQADTAKNKKEEHEKILKKFLRMQVQGLQSLASAGNIYAQEALRIKNE